MNLDIGAINEKIAEIKENFASVADKQSIAIAGEKSHQLNMKSKQALSEDKISEAVNLSLQSIGEQFKHMAGVQESFENPNSCPPISATQSPKGNCR